MIPATPCPLVIGGREPCDVEATSRLVRPTVVPSPAARQELPADLAAGRSGAERRPRLRVRSNPLEARWLSGFRPRLYNSRPVSMSQLVVTCPRPLPLASMGVYVH